MVLVDVSTEAGVRSAVESTEATLEAVEGRRWFCDAWDSVDARRSPARDRTLLDRPRPACELESLRGRGGSGGTMIGGGRCEGPAPGELVPVAMLVLGPELERRPARSLVEADWARAFSDAAARRRVRSGFLGGSAGGGGSFNAGSMSRERGWLCCHTKQPSTRLNLILHFLLSLVWSFLLPAPPSLALHELSSLAGPSVDVRHSDHLICVSHVSAVSRQPRVHVSSMRSPHVPS